MQLPEQFHAALEAAGENMCKSVLLTHAFCKWFGDNAKAGESYFYEYASGTVLEIVCHGDEIFADAFLHKKDGRQRDGLPAV